MKRGYVRRIMVASALGAAALASVAGAESASQVAVGSQAPAIEAAGSDGKTYASSQVLSGDKRLVLIFFRGAW